MAVKGIAREINTILEDYTRETKEAVEDAAKQAADSVVKELRVTSPGGGKYAKSWRAKNISTTTTPGYIVHNARHYRLTHLLENGHMIVNQFGVYGRTEPKEHIKPAEIKGIKEFENAIRNKLE